MNLKLFELRDAGTFIPIFAFRGNIENASTEEAYLLIRAGYSDTTSCIVIGRLDAVFPHMSHCTHDPFEHGDRTFQTAHIYIEQEWDSLVSGQVIDVEHILGETSQPKQSERVTH